MVFDKPSSTYFNPKIYEQKRRDNSTASSGLRQHISFEHSKALPNVTWQCISECRTCKECLIKGIGLIFYQMGQQQTLVLAGCFDDDIAWVIRNGVASAPQPEPQYHSNAKEADQLVWHHAVMCPSSTVLIFSPDTDIFVIELGFLSGYSKQFVVQNNLPHSGVQKYINVNNLPSALQNDSDFASLATETIPGIMVGLFAATGSDYTSYFKNIGKATFLNLFFQYSRFNSGNGMEGSLNEFNETTRESGFLSFLRLVGTAYFKQHFTSFFSAHKHNIPEQLFNSIDPNLTTIERHYE